MKENDLRNVLIDLVKFGILDADVRMLDLEPEKTELRISKEFCLRFLSKLNLKIPVSDFTLMVQNSFIDTIIEFIPREFTGEEIEAYSTVMLKLFHLVSKSFLKIPKMDKSKLSEALILVRTAQAIVR